MRIGGTTVGAVRCPADRAGVAAGRWPAGILTVSVAPHLGQRSSVIVAPPGRREVNHSEPLSMASASDGTVRSLTGALSRAEAGADSLS